MKATFKFTGILVLGLGLLATAGTKAKTSLWVSLKDPGVVAQLKLFVAEKEAQAKAAGGDQPREFGRFFSAAKKGDWFAVNSFYTDLQNHAPESFYSAPKKGDWFTVSGIFPAKEDDRIAGTPWEAVKETRGALEAFGDGNEKYSAAYAKSIIESIPPGSIYFGGTDPGRFLISGMEKSQIKGAPFFVLSQNTLMNNAYLNYLQAMYGGKIYTPTTNDVEKCFKDYVDAAWRMEKDSKGRTQVPDSQFLVMEVPGRLVKIMIDRNTNREFYVEESSPIYWMYPYLEPHGIIFKLNRQPLPGLSDEIVQRDRDYWMKLTAPMIGDWLKPDTTIEKASAFAEQVFAKKDFSGFTGDQRFVQNAYSHKMFSKERSAVGGLYAWRAQQATTDAEKQRMNDAADFAFRQAWALCPYSPEATFRYVDILVRENRFSDAQLVIETAEEMPQLNKAERIQIKGLMEQLQNIQRQIRGK